MQRNRYNNVGSAIAEAFEIESLVLNEIIADPSFMPTAKSVLSGDMFSDGDTQRAWEVLNEMFDKGQAIDYVTIYSRLGNDVAVRLCQGGYNASRANLPTFLGHCEALRLSAVRRCIYAGAMDMVQASTDNAKSVDDLVAMPSRLADALIDQTKVGGRNEVLGDVLDGLARTIEANQVAKAEGKHNRVPTGFRMLDALTYSGFGPGSLVVLAARPSVGKTAVMLQMARAAAKSGCQATIYSLEMTNQDLAQRLLFATDLVTPQQIIDSNLDWDDYEAANNQLHALPLHLNDTARTLDELTADITLSHQYGKCDIAFIDYLGLIRSTNPRQTIYQAVAERTARLKQLAKDCRIPIVLLCQLNRASATESRPPELYDLRDSGSIEQDADIVLMLEREAHDLIDTNVNMWVRKNRQGMAGNVCVRLSANNTFTEFYEKE